MNLENINFIIIFITQFTKDYIIVNYINPNQRLSLSFEKKISIITTKYIYISDENGTQRKSLLNRHEHVLNNIAASISSFT